MELEKFEKQMKDIITAISNTTNYKYSVVRDCYLCLMSYDKTIDLLNKYPDNENHIQVELNKYQYNESLKFSNNMREALSLNNKSKSL